MWKYKQWWRTHDLCLIVFILVRLKTSSSLSANIRVTGTGSNYTNYPKMQRNDLSTVENISKTVQTRLTRTCSLLTRTAANLLLQNTEVWPCWTFTHLQRAKEQGFTFTMMEILIMPSFCRQLCSLHFLIHTQELLISLQSSAKSTFSEVCTVVFSVWICFRPFACSVCGFSVDWVNKHVSIS